MDWKQKAALIFLEYNKMKRMEGKKVGMVFVLLLFVPSIVAQLSLFPSQPRLLRSVDLLRSRFEKGENGKRDGRSHDSLSGRPQQKHTTNFRNEWRSDEELNKHNKKNTQIEAHSNQQQQEPQKQIQKTVQQLKFIFENKGKNQHPQPFTRNSNKKWTRAQPTIKVAQQKSGSQKEISSSKNPGRQRNIQNRKLISDKNQQTTKLNKNPNKEEANSMQRGANVTNLKNKFENLSKQLLVNAEKGKNDASKGRNTKFNRDKTQEKSSTELKLASRSQQQSATRRVRAIDLTQAQGKANTVRSNQTKGSNILSQNKDSKSHLTLSSSQNENKTVQPTQIKAFNITKTSREIKTPSNQSLAQSSNASNRQRAKKESSSHHHSFGSKQDSNASNRQRAKQESSSHHHSFGSKQNKKPRDQSFSSNQNKRQTRHHSLRNLSMHSTHFVSRSQGQKPALKNLSMHSTQSTLQSKDQKPAFTLRKNTTSSVHGVQDVISLRQYLSKMPRKDKSHSKKEDHRHQDQIFQTQRSKYLKKIDRHGGDPNLRDRLSDKAVKLDEILHQNNRRRQERNGFGENPAQLLLQQRKDRQDTEEYLKSTQGKFLAKGQRIGFESFDREARNSRQKRLSLLSQTAGHGALISLAQSQEQQQCLMVIQKAGYANYQHQNEQTVRRATNQEKNKQFLQCRSSIMGGYQQQIQALKSKLSKATDQKSKDRIRILLQQTQYHLQAVRQQIKSAQLRLSLVSKGISWGQPLTHQQSQKNMQMRLQSQKQYTRAQMKSSVRLPAIKQN